MFKNEFYLCEHCGNIVEAIHNSGVPMMCCGQKMKKSQPNTQDASGEKHLPVISLENNTVTVSVGSVLHPMTAEHSILWVYLQTDKGCQRKALEIGSEPIIKFALTDEKPICVFAYCNLHGLWKTEFTEEKACPLTDVIPNSKENYTVCNCNKVSYFDILDTVYKHNKLEAVLDVFEDVKNTTHCSTGCGGCYDKVINIISDVLTNG